MFPSQWERVLFIPMIPLSLVVCLVRGGDIFTISGLHTSFERVCGLMGIGLRIGLFLVMC